MNRLKKAICLSVIPFLILLFTISSACSFPFQKKKDKEEELKEEPMVHTVEEWMESATNVKMDIREEVKDPFLKEDEKIIPPTDETPDYIEAYNVNAGSKELDLTLLDKEKIIRSPFVGSPDFKNAVYTETYLYPQTRQIASAVFLIDLDTDKSKKDRLKNTRVFEHERHLLVTTALPYFYDNFFSTLTVVDYSKDGKKVLIKEKRGSAKNGLYETYIWVYYISKENKYSHPAYINNFTSKMSQKPSFDDLEDGTTGFNYPMGEYNPNLNNLKDVPQGGLNVNGADNGSSHHNGQSSSADSNNSDPNKNPYEFSAPKLSYKNLSGFLTSNWKDAEMNSGLNSRWYNKIPDNYRADYDIGEKEKIGFGIRYNLLNEVIKNYWFDTKKLILNSIRWDLKPLGFSTENEDEIIADAFAYTKKGDKASLGRWAININTGIPRLMDEFEETGIQANAFWLVKKHNPR